LLPGALEDELAKAIDPVDQGVYDASVAHVLANHGQLDPQHLQTMAHQMRKSPAEVAALAQKVIAGFTTLVQQAVSPIVGDYDAFIAWAHQHRPDALQEARLALGMGRTTANFRVLADDFNRNSVPTAAEVRAAGYEVSTRNGVDIVKLPNGQEMSIASVAKAGLFKRG
jgi:hypothetical protein